jgi:hypothetical protein
MVSDRFGATPSPLQVNKTTSYEVGIVMVEKNELQGLDYLRAGLVSRARQPCQFPHITGHKHVIVGFLVLAARAEAAGGSPLLVDPVAGGAMSLKETGSEAMIQ